jgi:hypothetical protein
VQDQQREGKGIGCDTMIVMLHGIITAVSRVEGMVATTSLDLAIISLPRCQAFLDTSVTMFVSSLSVVT